MTIMGFYQGYPRIILPDIMDGKINGIFRGTFSSWKAREDDQAPNPKNLVKKNQGGLISRLG